MNIRKAELIDLPALDGLYLSLFKQMAIYEPNYMNAARQDEVFIKKIIAGEDNFIGFVYEEEEIVCGLAVAQIQSTDPYNCLKPLRCVYLMDIIVVEEMQGKGIGKALLQRVKDWGKSNQVNYFELTVLAGNIAAIALYQREGLMPFSMSMRMIL
ncbi:MAG: GNAT family N-acetyltransferase [Sphingobacterium sp.]|jgi:GNAT superfamily N-acetyltransferase|nr:GNAT family N-acetyltransferase [Sphingobacterium sp.]